MKKMPIITKGQITAIFLLLFFWGSGYILYLGAAGQIDLIFLPKSIFRQRFVQVHLSGAVSGAQLRRVDADSFLWEIIYQDNQYAEYVDWAQVPMGRRVYDGLDFSVPFRMLRDGEKLPAQLVQSGHGLILRTLPCLPEVLRRADKEKIERWLEQPGSGIGCAQKYLR